MLKYQGNQKLTIVMGALIYKHDNLTRYVLENSISYTITTVLVQPTRQLIICSFNSKQSLILYSSFLKANLWLFLSLRPVALFAIIAKNGYLGCRVAAESPNHGRREKWNLGGFKKYVPRQSVTVDQKHTLHLSKGDQGDYRVLDMASAELCNLWILYCSLWRGGTNPNLMRPS